MMRTIFTLIMILVPALVFANAGEGHHDEGIPFHTIFWQVLNLVILFSAIIYYTKDKIVLLFQNRKQTYLSAAQKSQAAREEAEKQFFDIKHKLEHLNSTTDESIARAEAEASDLRKQLLQEAEEAARKIKAEAESTVKLDSQRAQKELHDKFVKEAVAAARTVLSKDIAAADHQKLQSDFAKNIQAVNA